jgi:serine/threonine protein kinase
MRVSKADLGPLKELNEGGYGKVYLALNYHLPGDAATAIAYKEFTTDLADQERSAKNAVTFRDLLNPADKADLDRRTVWPRALVEERGGVVGLLMPLIPAEFFLEITEADRGKKKRKLRELQWLLATPKQLAENGVGEVADETERLAVLAQLVYAIARLHKQNLVYGDLSFKNAAYAINPPRLIVLDCDGTASLSDPLRKQAHSPGFKPPECQQVDFQDKATDVYKLGLLILRCLNPVKGAGTMTDPGQLAGKLDAVGQTLVAQALDPDPAKRPTAKELYGYLSGAVAARVAPPQVVSARLATPLRARGMDARVEWQIKNVQEITITVGSGVPQTVPTNGFPQVHVFQPKVSGPVTIQASNRFGAVRVDLGELTLYDLPPFEPDSLLRTLPRLTVPALESFTLDAIAPALATVPRVSMPEVPKVPSVPTTEMIDGLAVFLTPAADLADSLRFPDLSKSLRLPDLSAVAASPTRQIVEIISTQARQHAESRRASHLTAVADAEDEVK